MEGEEEGQIDLPQANWEEQENLERDSFVEDAACHHFHWKWVELEVSLVCLEAGVEPVRQRMAEVWKEREVYCFEVVEVERKVPG